MAVSSLCLSITSPPKLDNQNQPLNSALKNLSESGKFDEALHLLLESQQPTIESYTSLLHACISRKSLHHGKRLYLHLLESKYHKDLLKDSTLNSMFITLFSACGRLDEAFRAFRHGIEEMSCVGESVYVAMAVGFSKNGKFNEALFVYCEMLSKGIEPGNFAFSVALKVCSGLLDSAFGKSVHAQVLKAIGEPDQVVNNALLRFYSECWTFEEFQSCLMICWTEMLRLGMR